MSVCFKEITLCVSSNNDFVCKDLNSVFEQTLYTGMPAAAFKPMQQL